LRRTADGPRPQRARNERNSEICQPHGLRECCEPGTVRGPPLRCVGFALKPSPCSNC
jgi:hypothetical protein